MNGTDLNQESTPNDPEFSRMVKVTSIDSVPTLNYKATPEECELLAERFDLISLDGFSLEASLERWRKGVRVRGRITGQAVQRSVVSLDPVIQMVDEAFVRGFLPNVDEMTDVKPGAEIEMPLDTELDDVPEPLRGSQIDLGELASEALGLALDPYPRGETEDYINSIAGPPDTKPMTDEDAKPFASLVEYREKLAGDDDGKS